MWSLMSIWISWVSIPRFYAGPGAPVDRDRSRRGRRPPGQAAPVGGRGGGREAPGVTVGEGAAAPAAEGVVEQGAAVRAVRRIAAGGSGWRAPRCRRRISTIDALAATATRITTATTTRLRSMRPVAPAEHVPMADCRAWAAATSSWASPISSAPIGVFASLGSSCSPVRPRCMRAASSSAAACCRAAPPSSHAMAPPARPQAMPVPVEKQHGVDDGGGDAQPGEDGQHPADAPVAGGSARRPGSLPGGPRASPPDQHARWAAAAAARPAAGRPPPILRPLS